MRDRDGEMRRNAQESDLTPGDKVLVRQEREKQVIDIVCS